MLGWALTFLFIALIAALFGFGGVAGPTADLAKMLFVIFLALGAGALVLRVVRRRKSR